MKTILVAVDFSESALNAANYAADMACVLNAELILLHVYTLPVAFNEAPVMINPEEWKKHAEKDMLLLINDLEKRVLGKIVIRTSIVMGTFFQELKVACEAYQPYAAVLGSQGTTKAERLFFGGHTVYAMKHLVYPLISVPINAKFTAIRSMGLACDFEDVAETIPVDEVNKFANDFDSSLHIINTGRRDNFDPAVVTGAALLKNVLAPLQPVFHFITNEHIDEGIMRFTDDNQIDMLIVLPKKHTLLERLIHRSHTSKLVLNSHVPVMALHH